MSGGRTVIARVETWAGVDTDWVRRPDDPARTRRVDTWVALAFLVAGSLGVELLRSIDALGPFQDSWVWPHVAVLAGTLPLVWRRRWPLAVAAGLSLHFFVVGLTMPGTDLAVAYQKQFGTPHLVLTHMSITASGPAPVTDAIHQFRARAFHAAVEKARDV